MIPWKRWSVPLAAATLFALLVLPMRAEAQPGWSGTVTTLSAVDLRANDSEMAVDDAGNAFAIWSRGEGATEVIQVARYEVATDSWSSPISLSTVGQSVDDPRVTFDPTGNAVATWTRSFGRTGVVQAARYTAATNSWSAAADIAGAEDALFSDVVMDADGNAIVVWYHDQFPLFDLRASRYSASTGTWASRVNIASTGNAAFGGGDSLVIDADGNATVVWAFAQSTTQYFIQSARYTVATNTWSSTINVAGGAGQANKVRIGIDAAGNVMAVWLDVTSDRLQVARYSSATSAWSTATNLPSAGAGADGERLAVAPDGDAVVIWEQPIGSSDIVQAARFSVATGTWSAATSLSALGQDGDEVEVAVDGAGNAIAVWLQLTGSADIIQAARYTRSTDTWSTAVDLSSASDKAEETSLAFDGAGNAIVIWETEVATQDVVQATRWIASPAAVTTPTRLRASSIVGNTVTIVWDAPSAGGAVTGYVLEGGISPGQVLASRLTGSTATTFTFDAPTGVFFIRVHALVGAAKSAASNEIRIAVNVPTPPSAPVNLTGQANGSSLSLAWQNTAAGGTPTAITLEVTGSISTSFTLQVTESFAFSGVPPGTYTFAVRASNASGLSAASNPVTLTFGACAPPGVGVPTNFVASKNGNIVSVSWAPPATGPAPTGYVLLVSGSFVGSFPTTALALSAPVPPGSYTLRVLATHGCGNSAATPEQVVTIP